MIPNDPASAGDHIFTQREKRETRRASKELADSMELYYAGGNSVCCMRHLNWIPIEGHPVAS